MSQEDGNTVSYFLPWSHFPSRFEISDGKVMYNNRYVRSKTFEQNQAAGAITKAEFGTPGPSTKGVFSRWGIRTSLFISEEWDDFNFFASNDHKVYSFFLNMQQDVLPCQGWWMGNITLNRFHITDYVTSHLIFSHPYYYITACTYLMKQQYLCFVDILIFLQQTFGGNGSREDVFW